MASCFNASEATVRFYLAQAANTIEALTPRPQPDERGMREQVIEECAQVCDKLVAKLEQITAAVLSYRAMSDTERSVGDAQVSGAKKCAYNIRRLTHPSNTPKTDTGGK